MTKPVVAVITVLKLSESFPPKDAIIPVSRDSMETSADVIETTFNADNKGFFFFLLFIRLQTALITE